MRKLCILATLGLALALAPGAIFAQPMGAGPMMGVGPHGYDFLVGSWSCTNSNPNAMTGPAASILTATAAAAHGAIATHMTGTGFDGYGYVSYNPQTKVWSSPVASADGTYGIETTSQTGTKVVWTGTALDASSGKTIQIRDTYTMPSVTKYSDLSEADMGNGWQHVATYTCTKSM
jgi:hypothetical protein